MRGLGIIVFILSGAIAFAQVPNAGFENWSSRSKDLLEGYSTVGNVSKTSDAVNGSYALKLENKASNSSFGGVFNTVPSKISAGYGGQPYDEIPLVLSFSTKYDLAVGDIAKVFMIFKLQGNPIGSVDFTLNGNSADTFQRFNYAIQWGTSINPDTVLVVLASVDLNDPQVNGDGYVIFDDFVFRTFSTLNDSLENRSFEDWQDQGIDYPTSWYTSDLVLDDEVTGILQSNAAVTKAADVQSGSNSVLIQNTSVSTDIFPGVMVTGQDASALERPSFKVVHRWKYLHALTKYLPDNGDEAIIQALLFKNGGIIGSAEIALTDSSDQTQYTYIEKEITYINGETPDSATVIISCADFENPKGWNTKLWVDNVNFTDHALSIKEFSENIRVFPNPAQNIIHLDHGLSDETHIQIHDLMGAEKLSSDSSSIDISSLVPGVYIIQIHGKGRTGVVKFVKI